MISEVQVKADCSHSQKKYVGIIVIYFNFSTVIYLLTNLFRAGG